MMLATRTTEPPPALRIDIDFTARTCRLELTGELDAGTVDLLADAVDSALQRGRGVVVDLREVSSCDADGADGLVAARRRAEERGHTLRLTGVRSSARRAVHAVRVADLLV